MSLCHVVVRVGKDDGNSGAISEMIWMVLGCCIACEICRERLLENRADSDIEQSQLKVIGTVLYLDSCPA